MTGFTNQSGRSLILAMIAAIQQNAALLSEVDGAIGDGDHGINMNKGFSLAAQRLGQSGLTAGLRTVGQVLLEEIGGAMGPLYGSMFLAMADAVGDQDVDAAVFLAALRSARDALQTLGGARVGDKTLLDTLVPALEAYEVALANGASFDAALVALSVAARRGKDSTKDMVAQVGRSSRLGERSRGVLDAGAVSCWLLLDAMATAARELLS